MNNNYDQNYMRLEKEKCLVDCTCISGIESQYQVIFSHIVANFDRYLLYLGEEEGGGGGGGCLLKDIPKLCANTALPPSYDGQNGWIQCVLRSL